MSTHDRASRKSSSCSRSNSRERRFMFAYPKSDIQNTSLQRSKENSPAQKQDPRQTSIVFSNVSLSKLGGSYKGIRENSKPPRPSASSKKDQKEIISALSSPPKCRDDSPQLSDFSVESKDELTGRSNDEKDDESHSSLIAGLFKDSKYKANSEVLDAVKDLAIEKIVLEKKLSKKDEELRLLEKRLQEMGDLLVANGEIQSNRKLSQQNESCQLQPTDDTKATEIDEPASPNLDKLMNELKKKELSIAAQAKEIENYKSVMQSLQSELRSQSDEMRKDRKELAKCQKELAQLKQKAASKELECETQLSNEVAVRVGMQEKVCFFESQLKKYFKTQEDMVAAYEKELLETKQSGEGFLKQRRGGRQEELRISKLQEEELMATLRTLNEIVSSNPKVKEEILMAHKQREQASSMISKETQKSQLLENKISYLQEKQLELLGDKQKEINGLKKEIEQHKQAAIGLRQLYDKLRQVSKTEMDAKIEEIAKLNSQIQGYQNEIKEEQRVNSTLRSELKEKDKLIKQIRETKEIETEKRIQDLGEKLTLSSSQLEEIKARLAHEEKQKTKLFDVLKEKEQCITDLKYEIEGLNRRIEDLEEALRAQKKINLSGNFCYLRREKGQEDPVQEKEKELQLERMRFEAMENELRQQIEKQQSIIKEYECKLALSKYLPNTDCSVIQDTGIGFEEMGQLLNKLEIETKAKNELMVKLAKLTTTRENKVLLLNEQLQEIEKKLEITENNLQRVESELREKLEESEFLSLKNRELSSQNQVCESVNQMLQKKLQELENLQQQFCDQGKQPEFVSEENLNVSFSQKKDEFLALLPASPEKAPCSKKEKSEDSGHFKICVQGNDEDGSVTGWFEKSQSLVSENPENLAIQENNIVSHDDLVSQITLLNQDNMADQINIILPSRETEETMQIIPTSDILHMNAKDTPTENTDFFVTCESLNPDEKAQEPILVSESQESQEISEKEIALADEQILPTAEPTTTIVIENTTTTSPRCNLETPYDNQQYFQMALDENTVVNYYEEGRPDSPYAIIGIHHDTANLQTLQKLLSSFQDEYRTVCLDVSMYDFSRVREDESKRFAKDFQTFLDMIGVTVVTLVGCENSGFISMALAALLPNDCVDKIIAIGVPTKTAGLFASKVEENGVSVKAEVEINTKALDLIQGMNVSTVIFCQDDTNLIKRILNKSETNSHISLKIIDNSLAISSESYMDFLFENIKSIL